MKLDCGPTPRLRSLVHRIFREHWHKYFAWFPVRVGYKDCRWLEYVERKSYYVYYNYHSEGYWVNKYRAIEK